MISNSGENNHLLKDVILYNQSRLKAFHNGIEFIKNNEYEKILKSRYNKVSRIKQHLVYLLYHKKYHYFLTFTFDNELIKRCDRTKRDLIKASLNTFSNDILYILNIDYGSKTEREHYHCIVGTDSCLNLKQHLIDTYPSFTYCEPIRITAADIRKLSKYVNKLTNHCCKDSTYNKRVVYNFKGYDLYPSPLNRILYIQQSFNLGL